MRPLGATGPSVSVVALGTVKWGRNRGVKYPAFELPDDRTLHALLDTAAEWGLNLLDTAPAYGVSEERVGKVLRERGGGFLVATKTGEAFDPATGESSFDFSAAATRASVERSLHRLGRDALDLVCVHSSADDLAVARDSPVLETLADLRREGKVRAVGFSTMTVAGGLAAAEVCDVLMVPFNLGYQDHRPVIDRARELGSGVLVKRGLFSGGSYGPSDLPRLVAAVLGTPGVTSLVAGTIDPEHLRQNLAAASDRPPTL
jgi:aryl-alcohol dehydrogenase-like predicted oxidoreductase